MIAFLSRLKADDEELAQLRKVFIEMNTSKSGYLTAEELKEATTKFKSTIRKELGRDKGYELNWDKLV